MDLYRMCARYPQNIISTRKHLARDEINEHWAKPHFADSLYRASHLKLENFKLE